MQLEDGKTYIDGTGERITVKLKSPNSEYPFSGDTGLSYMADGRYVPEDDLPISVYHLVKKADER